MPRVATRPRMIHLSLNVPAEMVERMQQLQKIRQAKIHHEIPESLIWREAIGSGLEQMAKEIAALALAAGG